LPKRAKSPLLNKIPNPHLLKLQLRKKLMASMRKKNRQHKFKILKRLTNLHLFKKRKNLKLSLTKNQRKKMLFLMLLKTKKMRNNPKANQKLKKKTVMTKKRPMMILKKRKQRMRKKKKTTKMLMNNQEKKRKRTDGLVLWSIPYYQLDDYNGYI
jgi:hypothetical protein